MELIYFVLKHSAGKIKKLMGCLSSLTVQLLLFMFTAFESRQPELN